MILFAFNFCEPSILAPVPCTRVSRAIVEVLRSHVLLFESVPVDRPSIILDYVYLVNVLYKLLVMSDNVLLSCCFVIIFFRIDIITIDVELMQARPGCCSMLEIVF